MKALIIGSFLGLLIVLLTLFTLDNHTKAEPSCTFDAVSDGHYFYYCYNDQIFRRPEYKS